MGRSTQLTGAAGEHFVMYELLRRDFIAALTPLRADNIDILISDIDGSSLAGIQVKAMSEPGRKWQMSKKHEKVAHERLFYCFLRPEAENLGKPECWIMPSRVVAEHIALSHAAWLQGIPLRGSSRKDGSRRSMHFSCEPLDKYPSGWLDEYRSNWELLRA